MDPATRSKPDLLIVDDDPLISDTLNFVLSRDFNVYVADSREQMKSLIRQLEIPPKLALVDLGLPPTPHRPDEGWAPSISSRSRASLPSSRPSSSRRSKSPTPRSVPRPSRPAS
jgi:DNA-binding NarL/FixJ family response regulator